MSEEEKEKNDIFFTEEWAKKLERKEKYGIKPYAHNPLDKFECPVCKTTRLAKDMHKYIVMDNGTEILYY